MWKPFLEALLALVKANKENADNMKRCADALERIGYELHQLRDTELREMNETLHKLWKDMPGA